MATLHNQDGLTSRPHTCPEFLAPSVTLGLGVSPHHSVGFSILNRGHHLVGPEYVIVNCPRGDHWEAIQEGAVKSILHLHTLWLLLQDTVSFGTWSREDVRPRKDSCFKGPDLSIVLHRLSLWLVEKWQVCAQPHFMLVYSFLAPPPVLHCCCLVLHLPFPRQPLILASGSAFWRTLAKLFGKYITLGLRGGLHTFHSTEGVF